MTLAKPTIQTVDDATNYFALRHVDITKSEGPSDGYGTDRYTGVSNWTLEHATGEELVQFAQQYGAVHYEKTDVLPPSLKTVDQARLYLTEQHGFSCEAIPQPSNGTQFRESPRYNASLRQELFSEIPAYDLVQFAKQYAGKFIEQN
jgi:hypothetical protein